VRHRGIGPSDSEVVELPAQKDDLSVNLTSVDTSLVCDVHDIEIVENHVDVLFQQCTGFGVALQGLERW
jgi:hypothetical protein